MFWKEFLKSLDFESPIRSCGGRWVSCCFGLQGEGRLPRQNLQDEGGTLVILVVRLRKKKSNLSEIGRKQRCCRV